MGRYKGTTRSRHSSFRANLHTGKGIFFPIPSADLTGTSHRTCPGCRLVFTFVSSVGIAAIRQWVVKTFILISIFECLHMLAAGDTVRDQKPHKNPAPGDILVRQYIIRQVLVRVLWGKIKLVKGSDPPGEGSWSFSWEDFPDKVTSELRFEWRGGSVPSLGQEQSRGVEVKDKGPEGRGS